MDRVVLNDIVKYFLEPNSKLFEELDAAMRPRRGRKLLPVRVLLGGMVHQYCTQREKTITGLARTLAHESTGAQLAQLYGRRAGGRVVSNPPSRWRLYRTKAALLGAIEGTSGETNPKTIAVRSLLNSSSIQEAMDALSLLLIHSSAPPVEVGATISVDTTKIPAACRPVSQAAIKAGQFASDRDARWRRLERGVSSFEAGDAIGEEPSGKGGTRHIAWFGYWSTSVVLTQGGREYVYGANTRPANENDRPVSIKLVDRLLAMGDRPGRIIADRGFSDGRAFLDAMRERGISPVFDFKESQAKRDPDWRGCLVLQGWPFLPQLPRRLWYLVAPGVSERKRGTGKKRWEQFCRDIEEREQYAMVVHG